MSLNYLRESIQLPAPHASVWLYRIEKYPWGYIVTYGAPDVRALFAAGVISQAMMDQIQLPKRSKWVDEDGDRFFRKKRPLKSAPGRLELERWIHTDSDDFDVEKLLSLPGVREAFQRNVAAAERIKEQYGIKSGVRGRRVGRSQRVVEWTADAVVIVPDWEQIRASVAAARAR